MAKVGFGIAGTAEIGPKVIPALREAHNSQLLAVGSRDVEKAKAYCTANSAGEALSYEDLLARPDIDALYIPFPTKHRNAFIKKAIAAGKHIYSEKPLGGSVAELEELIDACAAANLQWIDGTMWYHSLRTKELEKALRGGAYGSVRRVTASFTFKAPDEAWLEGGNKCAPLPPADQGASGFHFPASLP